MYCPNCQRNLPEGTQACDTCGGPTPVYDPPEGFLWDKESRLFYRDEAIVPGASERWVTWFNPNEGDYQQVSYPVETPVNPSAPPQQDIIYDTPDFLNKKSNGKKLAIIIPLALVILLGLAAGGHFLGLYQLPLLPEAGGNGAEIAAGSTTTPGAGGAAPHSTDNGQAATTQATQPTPIALPESITYSQIDPFDMRHNGWALTREGALEEFGMVMGESKVDSKAILKETPQGILSGEIVGNYDFSSSPKTVFESISYHYELDDNMPPEDAVALFRLMVAAIDEELNGRNKVWNAEMMDAGLDFDSVSNQNIAEYGITHDGAISCRWGYSLGQQWYDQPCILSISLLGRSDHFYEIFAGISYDADIYNIYRNERKYFPDDAPGPVPTLKPTPAPTPAPQDASDIVRIGRNILCLNDKNEKAISITNSSVKVNAKGDYECSVTFKSNGWQIAVGIEYNLRGPTEQDTVNDMYIERIVIQPNKSKTIKFTIDKGDVNRYCDVSFQYYWSEEDPDLEEGPEILPGEVLFIGLSTNDPLPEYEGKLEIRDFKATRNAKGGNTCTFRLVNASYAFPSTITATVYGNNYNNLELTLADDYYFDKGGYRDFSFEIPADISKDGCMLEIEYTFGWLYD